MLKEILLKGIPAISILKDPKRKEHAMSNTEDKTLSEDNMIISPNPADGLVTFRITSKINRKSILQLFNIAGQLIRQDQINNHSPLSWNTQHLNPGVYFAKLVNNRNIISKKLIIVH